MYESIVHVLAVNILGCTYMYVCYVCMYGI